MRAEGVKESKSYHCAAGPPRLLRRSVRWPRTTLCVPLSLSLLMCVCSLESSAARRVSPQMVAIGRVHTHTYTAGSSESVAVSGRPSTNTPRATTETYFLILPQLCETTRKQLQEHTHTRTLSSHFCFLIDGLRMTFKSRETGRLFQVNTMVNLSRILRRSSRCSSGSSTSKV